MTLLDVPYDVPWKLIVVSKDMIDTTFCNKRFPYEWRSSLALSAYEPKEEEFPLEMCDQRITYLKVTCTITGYIPSQNEIPPSTVLFPDVPTEKLDRILGRYYGCYGALLNVAVFPHLTHGDKLRELKRYTVDFGQLAVGTILSNPYNEKNIAFTVDPSNRLVDLFPTDGDRKPELFLDNGLTATFPSSVAVEALIVLLGESSQVITMEAYKGAQLIGSNSIGSESNKIHKLLVEGPDIDKAIIKTNGRKALLLEFSYSAYEERSLEIDDYPHIIDFEPKVRDLYQTATEEGEILTASKEEVTTTKSFTHTHSTETGVSLAASLGWAAGQGGGPFGSVSGGMTSKWGDSSQDSTTTTVDNARERRERQATTTNISQLYNLLTGYHAGTNRAVFLMLPRPHILQATPNRTFTYGLRVIEGIQEFFLIVLRPKEINGLCIESFLETGHFKEGIFIHEPSPRYHIDEEKFEVVQQSSTEKGEAIFDIVYNVIRPGFIIDTDTIRFTQHNPDITADELDKRIHHTGVHLDEIVEAPLTRFMSLNYKAESSTAVRVTGKAHGVSGAGGECILRFTVFTRSERPIPTTEEEKAEGHLLITERNLCTCIETEQGCPKVIDLPDPGGIVVPISVVDEKSVSITPIFPEELKGRALPDTKSLLSSLRSTITGSSRSFTRRPFGKVSFIDSDEFNEQIMNILPDSKLKEKLSNIKGIPKQVLTKLGSEYTVKQALQLNLMDFANSTGLDLDRAVNIRRKILGLRVERQKNQYKEGGNNISNNNESNSDLESSQKN